MPEGESATPDGSVRPAADVDASTQPSRGQNIAAIICVVLAALLMTPAAVAYWGQRTLNDTERYVATVGPLVESPEVQDAIATKVTDAIQQQVDVETIINNVFAGVITSAPRLQQLVVPLSAAINGLIERQVRELVASDEFATFWERANARAQQALHRVLTGEGTGAVTLQGGQVVLDVDEVINRVKERLVDRGLTIVENAPIPETDRQIVLVDAPQVEQLRTIYAFGNPVARWLLPLVGLLYVAAFLLARRRAAMTVAIGATLVANAVLVAFAMSVGRQLFVNELAGTVFGPASRVFFDTLLVYLERGQQAVLWLGLVVLVAGVFAGSNRYGTAVRTGIANGLDGVGSALADSGAGAPGRWCAANERWLRGAVIVLGFVVLFWGNTVTVGRLGWSVALVLVLLACLQVLAGAGRALERTPSAPPEAATT